MREKAKRTFQVPHTYTIIFILMIIVAVMTWVVPSGTFATTEIDGREVTVAGTYEQMDKTFVDGETGKQVDLRQGPGAVLEAPIAGIMAAAEVVAFVFIVGGAFQIITATGAIDAGMRRVVRRFKSKDILVIPIAMLLFALGGSTFGMAEETLPFFAIFLPIMIAMGFDSLTAFMIVFIGAKAGYIASTVNPFSVLIAQGVIGITGNPQLWLRAIMFVVIVGLSIGWVVLYARKVRKNPELSLTFHDDKQKRLDMGAVDDDVPFTTAQKWILVVFLAGMALIVWGLVSQGWYMSELSAVFLAMGLLAGIIARFSQQKIAQEFVVGLKDFAFSAIVIGLARGVNHVLTEGMISDTMLNAASNLVAGMSGPLFVVCLLLIFFVLGFVVPSSSGLAVLAMPIFAPLADTVGIPRWIIVAAYQFGQYAMLYIAPTGLVMATLQMLDMKMSHWFRFVWPMMVFTLVFGAILLSICSVVFAV